LEGGVLKETVVDAEGAGDTFTSALINAIAEGKTVSEAAHEAMLMVSTLRRTANTTTTEI
jgi:sugar/nucleoside kinase (ribokinase family)